MINSTEIDEKAKRFDINVSNVQKDYVFGWILRGIFTVSDLKDTLFLKGGNALRKGYFENTRFSNDLDFGIPHDIDPNVLLAEINKVCDFIHEKAGIVFVKDDNRIEEKFTASETPLPDLKVYEMRIYFKDFYGKAGYVQLRISMDITRFDKVLLPLQTVPLIHPYSDAAEIACDIRCVKLEEIIATKLKCLMQRQHAADLFDYAYSIKLLGGTLDKEEVVRTFVAKTIFSRNPHMLKGILHKTPFDFFKQYWEKSIVCAKEFLFGVDEAIQIFLTDLEILFSSYQDNGYAQFAYFGPELRAPIMQAGRSQTLLKIRYKGTERLIEPYSLKYMQQKNGEEREYLYAYNLTGSENPPGMRTFVADRIESIENTDQKFETLRYPIELSKAGELPENRYLFDPNRPTRPPRPRTRPASMSSGMKHIFECMGCSKKFTRSSYSSALKSHNDRSGYPCYSRTGFHVDTRY